MRVVQPDLKKYLPTTKKELDLRGWDSVDVVLFSGDAYIDHPSFGAAVIGRVLEHAGYRVAIVPQPDWRGDHRDFTKLGTPRLFFAVTAGSMDSMVNHYTAARRLRSDDAYTPEGKAGLRPDYCTITYCKILRQHFPNTPIVIGGIEASMRRLAHYDYWSDTLMPSILADSTADWLIYGAGEKQIVAIARYYDSLQQGMTPPDKRTILQTAFMADEAPAGDDCIRLCSFEEEQKDKRKHAEDFRLIEIESNKIHSQTLVQPTGKRFVVVNPTCPTMTTDELDAIYDLPFQYLPHPKYKDKRIPAYEMIRFSVCMHRGCFGGCAFCTISAHQGKQIVSRSKASILRQIERLKDLPDWKGYLSDLGGPSANMYRMRGEVISLCEKCVRPSCLQPQICKNLNRDFAPLLDIYRSVDKLPYIKRAYVGSGIRYDLMSEDYGRQLITRHVSGRLKVAPEHTSAEVLRLMRKPSWEHYLQFRDFFLQVNAEAGLNQQIIPYFISSHPGCSEKDMANLAEWTKKMHYRPEQVQDFTPTPMTLSTTMFYTGLNPYTMLPVYVARSKQDKQKQRDYFFWWKTDRNTKQNTNRLWQKQNTISTRKH
ncbi:MAG: YgiQ family radical SAM protein [Paludibacteraceae bacterium]|nr:YgiQ family radical SAM protein [Paludibacteraceae bacterium]